MLAHALHATLTASEMLADGFPSLNHVRAQLLHSRGQPSHDAITLPDKLRLKRSTEPVLRAAHATLDELPLLPNGSERARGDAMTERLIENYLVEIIHQQFLGIVEVRAVPTYYPSSLAARESLAATVKELRARVGPTVREICADLKSPHVTRVSRPKRAKKSQEDVLATEIPVKLE